MEGVVLAHLRAALNRLTKVTNLSGDRWCSDRNSNCNPSERKSEDLPFELQCVEQLKYAKILFRFSSCVL